MNLHQVLTGAVNPGDHCFSVGSVGDQRFTVSEGLPRRPWRVRAPESAGIGPESRNRGQERLVARTGVPRSPTKVPTPRTGQTWLLRAKEVETCQSSRH